MELLDQYHRSLDRVGTIVAGVKDDQWADPTPCTEWDVRTLTNHIIGGLLMFGTAAAGESMPEGDPGDLAGDDAAAAYTRAADIARAGFGAEGVAERIVHLPIGDMPGGQALAISLSDLVVHGWDLAKATGQATEIPSPEVAVVDGILRPMVGPAFRQPDGQFAAFAPEVEVGEGASDTDRLVAFLGRRP